MDDGTVGTDSIIAEKFDLIDFGLSKRFRDGQAHRQTKYIQGKSLTGTARCASLNASLGGEQSGRDDLEPVGFVMVYFLQGTLPWQGLKAANKRQKYEKIAEKKLATTVNQLCDGLPTEFSIDMNYSRGLLFEEEPDYTYLKQILRLVFRSMSYQYDSDFDWINSDDPLVTEMINYSGSGRKKENQRTMRRTINLQTEYQDPKN